MSLEDLLRDQDILLQLEPEELAVYLLERFRNTSPVAGQTQNLNNFVNGAIVSHQISPDVEAALHPEHSGRRPLAFRRSPQRNLVLDLSCAPRHLVANRPHRAQVLVHRAQIVIGHSPKLAPRHEGVQ